MAAKKETAQVEQKENREQMFALWKNKSKSGNVYFSGRDKDDRPIVAFYGTNKEKTPDLKVFLKLEDGKLDDEEIGAFWKHDSKKGNTYLSGKYAEQKVICFLNKTKKNEKEPDIRAYLSTRVGDNVTVGDIQPDDMPF